MSNKELIIKISSNAEIFYPWGLFYIFIVFVIMILSPAEVMLTLSLVVFITVIYCIFIYIEYNIEPYNIPTHYIFTDSTLAINPHYAVNKIHETIDLKSLKKVEFTNKRFNKKIRFWLEKNNILYVSTSYVSCIENAHEEWETIFNEIMKRSPNIEEYYINGKLFYIG